MSVPNVVVADPPWSFGDKLPGKSRGAEKNYKVMTITEIENLKPEAAPDSLLFMWRVASQVEEAMRVVRAWGYTPKSEIVWVKTTSPLEQIHTPGSKDPIDRMPKIHFGMGRYTRASHEICVIAARGKAIPLIKSRSVRSVFFAPVREHSAKPEEFYTLIETLAQGPYLELFARRTRPGWMQWGDELGKLDAR